MPADGSGLITVRILVANIQIVQAGPQPDHPFLELPRGLPLIACRLHCLGSPVESFGRHRPCVPCLQILPESVVRIGHQHEGYPGANLCVDEIGAIRGCSLANLPVAIAVAGIHIYQRTPKTPPLPDSCI